MATATVPFDVTAGNHGGNPESVAANAAIHNVKEEVRLAVLDFARSKGADGVTADEVAAAWNTTHNHVAPRVTELKIDGRLVQTKHRRPTRSGCTARVLVAKEFATEEQMETAPVLTPHNPNFIEGQQLLVM